LTVGWALLSITLGVLKRAGDWESVTFKPQAACFVALAGAAVLAASATLTWTSVNIGSGSVSYTLLEIPVAAVLLGAGVLVVVGAAFTALSGRTAALEVAGLAAAAIALAVTFFLLVSESIAAFTAILPRDPIPLTAQRFALGAGTGAGPWLAVAAAGSIAVATTDSLRRWAFSTAATLRMRAPLALAALAVLVVAVVALVQLRQEPWLVAEAFGGELSINGDTVPWIGRAAYFAPWLVAGGIVCVCLGALKVGALVAGLAGWLANAAAGVTIFAGEALASLPVDDARVTASASAWLTFAAGLVTAAAAAGVLWWGGEGV
jgi:hypothetical protein